MFLQLFLAPLTGLHVEVLEDVVFALGADLRWWHLQWIAIQWDALQMPEVTVAQRQMGNSVAGDIEPNEGQLGYFCVGNREGKSQSRRAWSFVNIKLTSYSWNLNSFTIGRRSNKNSLLYYIIYIPSLIGLFSTLYSYCGFSSKHEWQRAPSLFVPSGNVVSRFLLRFKSLKHSNCPSSAGRRWSSLQLTSWERKNYNKPRGKLQHRNVTVIKL